MLQFGNLNNLWFLIILPAMGVFFFFAVRSKEQALRRFAGKHLLGVLLPDAGVRHNRVQIFAMIAAIALMIFALIEPKWGYTWEELKRKGVDIMVAIDVSQSMLAEDVMPNRLEAAKREIKSMINFLKGDRIGLIAFGGKSFTKCPLTLDYGVAKAFLDDINVDAIPVPGTDIGGAIDRARKSFSGFEKKHRVLILITDGEDHEQKVIKAVEEAKKDGIVIYTVGIGTAEGAPIPVRDENGQKSFLKDRAGNIVLTKTDPVILQKIALLTGGKKGMIGGGQFPLEDIYNIEIAAMEKKELESARRRRYENRFQIPLFLALILVVFEGWVPRRRHAL